jgi:DNA primase
LNTPVILAFDSDKAGFSAAKKVAYDQLSRGVDLRVFIPPPGSEGKDVDDIFRDNPSALRS